MLKCWRVRHWGIAYWKTDRTGSTREIVFPVSIFNLNLMIFYLSATKSNTDWGCLVQMYCMQPARLASSRTIVLVLSLFLLTDLLSSSTKTSTISLTSGLAIVEMAVRWQAIGTKTLPINKTWRTPERRKPHWRLVLPAVVVSVVRLPPLPGLR